MEVFPFTFGPSKKGLILSDLTGVVIFYGRLSLSLCQVGQLSVTGANMYAWYLLRKGLPSATRTV